MRNEFARVLTNISKNNHKIILLSGDIGNRLFDDFKSKYKDRFLNCGVAEQCMTGVAAGISLAGLLPITYTITPFNTLRNLEQIKIDLCYQNLHSIIVGTGSALSYSALGTTHHSLDDIGHMLNIPNMNIYTPCDKHEIEYCILDAIKNRKPSYIRLGKKGEQNIHMEIKNKKNFKSINTIKKGKKVALCGVGTITYNLLTVKDILKDRKNIDASVYGITKIQNNDQIMNSIIKKYEKIIIVEEHYANTGYASYLMNTLKKNQSRKIYNIGIEKLFYKGLGEKDNAHKVLGLDPKSLSKTILHLS